MRTADAALTAYAAAYPRRQSPHPPSPTRGPPIASSPGRHRRAPEHQASYREVFAIREFRGLWSAQVLSYGGDQFAQVAIAILVYHRTHSPFLTALAYALTYLPPIIGGPFLSGLADFIPRRQVMIACDVTRAGLVGLMAIPAMPLPVALRTAVLHRAARRAVLVGPHGTAPRRAAR